MIVITSQKDGFRRCGIAHPARETTYPDRRFSKEQLAILQAETMLTVDITAGDPRKKPAKDKE